VKAIRDHLTDFAAIIGLIIVSAAVGGYILANQRLRFPFIEDKPTVLKAEFSTAQAVTPGQGQTVRISGVKIGDIGKVQLKEGRAGRRAAHRQGVRGRHPRGRHRAAAPEDRAEGHVHRGRARRRARRPRELDDARSPTRCPTSTPTRSSPRWTPTRATTCGCWSTARPTA
jgi:hypothetical protein